MNTIKFDVGANTGVDTQTLASDGSTVYAFEPTHELLYKHLWPLSFEMPNIIVVPFAVDIESSFKKFNVAGHNDWGCSSLHEFSDDIRETWSNRDDFSTTHSYTVPTITLYDFINLYNIPTIDYLHVDAQGNDFNVLLSLKDKISIVKAGVVEAANNVNLYKNVSNNAGAIRNFLLLNGFEITSEYPNDSIAAEINIHFVKK